jgi:hypothetical protein
MSAWGRYLCPQCGGVAFVFRVQPYDDTILSSATIQHVDGRSYIDDDGTGVCGEILVCDACGRGIDLPLTWTGIQAG